MATVLARIKATATSIRGRVRGSLRSFWQLTIRASFDVFDEIGHDVRFGLVVAALGTLIAGALGAPLDLIALGNLIAVAVVPALYFLYHFFRAWKWPHRHKEWVLRDHYVVPYGEGRYQLQVYVSTKIPRLTIGVSSVEVIDPEGNVWREPPDDRQDDFRPMKGLFCHYPESFPGAPPLRPGTYKFSWRLRAHFGIYRQVVGHSVQVTPQELQQ